MIIYLLHLCVLTMILNECMYVKKKQKKPNLLTSLLCKLCKQCKVFWICTYFRVHSEEQEAMKSNLLTVISWSSGDVVIESVI